MVTALTLVAPTNETSGTSSLAVISITPVTAAHYPVVFKIRLRASLCVLGLLFLLLWMINGTKGGLYPSIPR